MALKGSVDHKLMMVEKSSTYCKKIHKKKMIILGGSKRVRYEMINQKYGNLTVLEYSGLNNHKKSQWKCQCDCGNIIIVNQQHLINGNSTRCKECAYKLLRKPRKDLSGQKFGKLTVLEYAGDRTYKCLCDCGTETMVKQNSLISGNTRSCGCGAIGQNGSQQEKAMIDIIKSVYGDKNVLDIKKVGNYRPDCVLDYNGHLYDIEYDGKHWHDEEHDKKRDEYFISRGFNVIRFVCVTRTVSKEFVKKEDIIGAINHIESTNDKVYKKFLQ